MIDPRPQLAVLLTCHDRREQTLACLRSILSEPNAELEVVLVDDGSTDGTAVAVAAEFPEVRVVHGDGDLFWCRGMELAWQTARSGHDRLDAYLWVNDDVVLAPDAIERLEVAADEWRARTGAPAIVVGSLSDPGGAGLTYGGYRRSSPWHPGRLTPVEPDAATSRRIDTFNGNLVLVPVEVVDRIGIIDGVFSHATGDVDYGLRATAAGIDVVLAPGEFGSCARNPPLEGGLRALLGRKGLPWRDWLVYTRRHGGRWRWPLAFVGPYVFASINSIRGGLGRG